ncbi:ROK family transcriptional regulator [Devosia sp.]|uniref:ROK family transcriptional regulator n=1 Tax=Devosia sp. TaxID=1871048 RepID=UPI003F72D35A
MQHASLRAANRRAVLTTITFSPGISNAEVSRRTGLAPQTASAIVTELEDDGLVTRGDVLRGRRGQPATPLYLDYGGAYGIGCEVSWRHIDIKLINLGSEDLGHYRRDFAYPDAAGIVAEAAEAIAGLIARLDPAQQQRVAGIGLATPSNFGSLIGNVSPPAEQLQAWRELDLRAALEAATGLATTWFNDGNCACFAEMVMSPPPRPANLVHLFVSTYLGAGITAEHTLWEGPTGNSANLGSMLVNGHDGHRSFGHDIASTSALGRRLAQAGITLPLGDHPANWPWSDWEAHIAPWVEASGSALAEIIVNTGAVLEIDHAIVDSIAPQSIIDRLVAATERALGELVVIGARRPRLVAGTLGARATPLGAAQLTMFRKHFSRDLSDMLAAGGGE